MYAPAPPPGQRHSPYAPPPPHPSQKHQYPSPIGSPHYPQQQHPPPPQRHKGTLHPGQIVNVDQCQVRIERYLSEGGYAHVYLTTSDSPIYPPSRRTEKKGRWGEKGYTQHCLKRIAFQDDSVWVDVKKEIEVMKSLPPNSHLVQYLGSSHTRSSAGQHEVFILMEFCAGGGIIDLLNKRLRDRLKEIEILNIFTDVCEAVAAMHSLKQPLLHRDLKIENVLSQPVNVAPTPQRPTPLVFKLCDFGSTTFPADRPPQTKVEADALAMDLNRHTTLQYRSPEMVEPMLGLPVGLPSDVWALGCLLYKLCYYTTPFEEHGPLAIVNAKYTFPPMPQYSPQLQHLIASMLVEQPARRPTVFEVLRVAHEMSGTRPEVDYPMPSKSLPIPVQPRPTKPQSHSSNNLLDFTGSPSSMNKSPLLQPSLASTVQPQRRGRPTRDTRESPRPTVQSQTRWQQSPTIQTLQKPQTTSNSANVRTAPSRLHITGENAPLSSGSAPLSATSPPPVDAFGMPIVPSTQLTATGFGDSFGGASVVSPTGTTTGSSQPSQSRYGPSLVKRPVGFGDSFGSASVSGSGISRTPSISSQPPPAKPYQPPGVKRVPSGATTLESSKRQHASTMSQKSPEPPTSVRDGDGDLSFESRFPSIETLNSGGESTPTVKSPSEKRVPPPLVSPLSSETPGSTPAAAAASMFGTTLRPRPSVRNRPSMSSNLTGGHRRIADEDARQTMQGEAKMHVQPRSTQVTGTAFRGQVSGLAPNLAQGGGREGRGGYREQGRTEQRQEGLPVEGVQNGEEEEEEEEEEGRQKEDVAGKMDKKIPEDLMGSEEMGSLQIPSIVPIRSISPAASAISGISSTTSTKDRGPPLSIDVTKTGSTNILSDNWSPLEEMRRRDAAERAEGAARKKEAGKAELERQKAEQLPNVHHDEKRKSSPEPVDSSDEEQGPEDPGMIIRSSAATSAQPTVAPNDIVSREPAKSATLPEPFTQTMGPQRIPSHKRARPQSMFLSNTSSDSVPSRNSLLSPPLRNEPSPLPSSQSPSQPSNLYTSQPNQGHQKKDSINRMVSKYESMSIGKPGEDANKTSTVNQQVPKPSEGTNASSTKPSVASKPVNLRKPSADLSNNDASAANTAQKNDPASPTKPRVASKPSTLRQDSGVGIGYIRPGMSASPSARPPNPVVSTSFNSNPDRQGKEDEVVEKDILKSAGSSPEKQQPVNLLIQRWNKGEVHNSSANAAKLKKGGYI
ncbi:NAK protein kinase [Cryptococcus gattii E566]|uniref:non-specific serine/threonine protein kinase n=2 Tax=Cryptococcus gattii TaxID=37769 RepID=E6QZJ5_CRYGW|nr:Serine/threonine-protein kinase, putative [Cryptococcus gattii WM276]ADV19530.1 Serine/threonine-protein kinase, putative [Cryptococcus gattii WM276]KIR79852.1 NAK protein kinase [Cryptococcus gattii EJB2]KIY34246.1 NAK protein kinase [Cryptococcus gattii E566]KJE00947.1 NAK protein kinase [Cryptococcus gattii NT-10]